MNLVIVESPAKCSKIQGFLGSGWRVVASMGHIRALEEDLEAIGLENNFEPKFHFLKEKSKAIANLKEAAANADKVYLAADDDREGEAIAFSVALLLKLPIESTPRAVFHEITEKAVKDAIQNPRRLDMNRVYAQQCRAMLDLMVGFTISPLLWKHVSAKSGLSAGRCQTPALRLVTDRENEIRGFKSSSSWKVQGQWRTDKYATQFPGRLLEDLEDDESANNYLENISSEPTAIVTDAGTKPWTESPPKPLITSTLQQEASALYGCNPKSTMSIAQKLYEAGHITYMRTDKAILSEDAIDEIKQFLEKQLGKEYIGSSVGGQVVEKSKAKGKKKEDGPKAQEAHEAIRPTHFDLTALPEDWDGPSRNIYRLIWSRAVQSVMSPVRGEQRTITFQIENDETEFSWESKWRRTTFKGWRVYGAIARLDEKEEEDTKEDDALWKIGEAIDLGMKVQWSKVEAIPYQTKAPTRYTEATLVRELEKRGIGRPSTFASLLASILDKQYVEKLNKPAEKLKRVKLILDALNGTPKKESFEVTISAEKEKMVPTALGERVLKFCVDKFNDLFEYGFTAQMETRLDKIADGNEVWKQVLKDTWNSYKDRYVELKSKESIEASTSDRQKEFGNGLKVIQTKQGPVLIRESESKKKEETIFMGWPNKSLGIHDMTKEMAEAFEDKYKKQQELNQMGELDGESIVKKEGKFGKYVQWGSINLSVEGNETYEQLVEKLRAKKDGGGKEPLHILGNYEFHKGPYGIYMFDKKLKARKFVGLPSELDPKILTAEAAEKIYKSGLDYKKSQAARGGFTGGSTGSTGGSTGFTGARGRGGRGRGRGRGRGK